MTERFTNLKKIPMEPAARILSERNVKLRTPLDSPASAPVSAVLAELDKKQASIDMIILLSAALPPREAVWWSCLAAREMLGDAPPTACLKVAEAWVFEPKDNIRAKLVEVLEHADPKDVAAPCATAALYAPGNLGPGEMAEHPAPPGVVASCVFTANIKTLKGKTDTNAQLKLLIERGLDIARGGNGRIDASGDAAKMPEKGEA